VSRRLSVVVGFCCVCVIDAILAKSPADYVRRATVPAGSPTLGLGHLQFEALITIARGLANINDFALEALLGLLGLLGLRVFEACGAGIADLGVRMKADTPTDIPAYTPPHPGGGDWGGINYPLHAVEYKRRAGRQVRDHVHRAERLGPSAHAAIT